MAHGTVNDDEDEEQWSGLEEALAVSQKEDEMKLAQKEAAQVQRHAQDLCISTGAHSTGPP